MKGLKGCIGGFARLALPVKAGVLGAVFLDHLGDIRQNLLEVVLVVANVAEECVRVVQLAHLAEQRVEFLRRVVSAEATDSAMHRGNLSFEVVGGIL
eukprot:CAMPEP_0115429226 /NCGR_PEP_ID=MMETSP0271-20121206/30400_1 /TAXON_ID=71861 /ORGANISM="Scrippsiella trochoidea, Strain CCMP3099" /LENGTH=96 /DNA_ID=CAMNT_0002854377 /DNA_START=589 /DNA_END=879 /DNA_ORIENTATION=+